MKDNSRLRCFSNEELWEEIKARNDVAILATCTELDSEEEMREINYTGGVAALGLATLAKARMLRNEE